MLVLVWVLLVWVLESALGVLRVGEVLRVEERGEMKGGRGRKG